MAHSLSIERLSLQASAQLVSVARAAIAEAAKFKRRLDISSFRYADELYVHRACFVTLEIDQSLRGCIGTLAAYRPLIEDVADNAFNACLRDPRFPPVTVNELQWIHAEVSVLSAPKPMNVYSETELMDALVPFRDGLVIDDGIHRATFLPAVWEQLPEKQDFVEHLKLKAGMGRHGWSSNIRCSSYTVEKYVVPDITGR